MADKLFQVHWQVDQRHNQHVCSADACSDCLWQYSCLLCAAGWGLYWQVHSSGGHCCPLPHWLAAAFVGCMPTHLHGRKQIDDGNNKRHGLFSKKAFGQLQSLYHYGTNTCHFCLTLVSPSPTPPNLHQPSMSIGMGSPTWVDSLMGHQITSTMAEDAGPLSHADSVHLHSIWNNVCLPVSHFEQYHTTRYVCVYRLFVSTTCDLYWS